MARADEALACAYFFLTLGFPWALAFAGVCLAAAGSRGALCAFGAAVGALAVHPLPRAGSLRARSSRLSLAIVRYFSLELLVDRDDPLLAPFGRGDVVESVEFQRSHHLPALYLACPHGVFNYGAIAWCCVSRWVAGWYQSTGAATAVQHAPGIRYLDPLIWAIGADRRAIQGVLRDTAAARGGGGGGGAAGAAVGAARRGGMLGMVPDGILGAFRSRPGVDEALDRPQARAYAHREEEGATVFACWFFGTSDVLSVVKDPFGILEAVSRKRASP